MWVVVNVRVRLGQVVLLSLLAHSGRVPLVWLLLGSSNQLEDGARDMNCPVEFYWVSIVW